MSRNSHPCAKCHKPRFICNVRHQLCQKCNGERLDERKAQSTPTTPKGTSFKGGAKNGQRGQNTVRVLNKVSKKQQAINESLRKTYNFIDATREPKCTGCGSYTKPLSRSHTISQDRCKKIGKTELIWDKGNLEFECFTDSDSCHRIWENGTPEQKRGLLNFESKLAYIKKHDEELYQRIINEL